MFRSDYRRSRGEYAASEQRQRGGLAAIYRRDRRPDYGSITTALGAISIPRILAPRRSSRLDGDDRDDQIVTIWGSSMRDDDRDYRFAGYRSRDLMKDGETGGHRPGANSQ